MDREFRRTIQGGDPPADRSYEGHPPLHPFGDDVPASRLHRMATWEDRTFSPPHLPAQQGEPIPPPTRHRSELHNHNERPVHRNSPEGWGFDFYPTGRASPMESAPQRRYQSPPSSYVVHGSQSSRGTPSELDSPPHHASLPTQKQNVGEQFLASGATGRRRFKRKSSKSDEKVDKASWDENKHKVFIRLCVQQKLAGNKPSNTLNKVGYENLE